MRTSPTLSNRFEISWPRPAAEARTRPAKRAFDFIAAALGLLVLAPLFAIVAALIKGHDGGPVFFRQTRIGRFGEPFRIWKFRTMAVDAGMRGGSLTIGRDPRVTRPGSWLRQTKLDELPQLINVLRGEMSLVGPRPEVPRYVELYDEEARRVLDLMPGITDPASIAFRDESSLLGEAADPEAFYVSRIMPAKIRLNLDYARRANLWTDVVVILQTLFPWIAGPAPPPEP